MWLIVGLHSAPSMVLGRQESVVAGVCGRECTCVSLYLRCTGTGVRMHLNMAAHPGYVDSTPRGCAVCERPACVIVRAHLSVFDTRELHVCVHVALSWLLSERGCCGPARPWKAGAG